MARVNRVVFDPELKAGGVDKNKGGAEKLRHYWTRGEGGAKIGWGTPGDFTRCVEHLTQHLGPRAKGYCALRHKEMDGFYPGDHRNKGFQIEHASDCMCEGCMDPEFKGAPAEWIAAADEVDAALPTLEAAAAEWEAKGIRL